MTPIILYFIFIWTVVDAREPSEDPKWIPTHFGNETKDNASLSGYFGHKKFPAKLLSDDGVYVEGPEWKDWLCNKIASLTACVSPYANLHFRIRNNDVVIHDFFDRLFYNDDKICAFISSDVLIAKFRGSEGCSASNKTTLETLHEGSQANLTVIFGLNRFEVSKVPYERKQGIELHALVNAEDCHPTCVMIVDGENRDLTAIVLEGDKETFRRGDTDQKVVAYYGDLLTNEGLISDYKIISSTPSTTTAPTATTSSTTTSKTTSSTVAVLMRFILFLMCWIVL